MKIINLDINSVEVKAEVRQLKCQWTYEMSKDLEVHADIDMNSFERYISREIRKDKRKNSINKLFF